MVKFNLFFCLFNDASFSFKENHHWLDPTIKNNWFKATLTECFQTFFHLVFNVRRKKLCKTAWPCEKKKWEKRNANCYLSHVVPWNMCFKPVVMREISSNILRWFFSPTQRVTPDRGKYHLKCKFSVPARKLMPKRLISKMYERISHGIRTYRARLLAFSIASSQLITTCIVTSSLMSGGKLCISRCVSFLQSRL